MKKAIIMALIIVSFFLTGWMKDSIKPFTPLDYLAAKTPYWSPPPMQTKDLEGCVPVHINYVGRHGSRHLKNSKDIETIREEVLRALSSNQLKKPLGPDASFALRLREHYRK